MKKSVVLLSMVLLVFSASARADGIQMSATSVSLNSFQVSMSMPCGLPVCCPSPCLIPPVVCVPHTPIILCPTANPCMILNPCVGLIGGCCVQPQSSAAMLATQMMMTTGGANAALAIMASMH